MLAALVAVCAAIVQPAAAQTWQPKDGDRLVFDVFRDGSKFGSHIVAFRRSGDDLVVDSDVELRVALGPITLFHYIHDVTERWSGGTLRSVVARTRKDGRWKNMTLQAEESAFRVAGSGFSGIVAADAIPSTHWNFSEMKQPAMLSTETGAMLPMTVTDRGVQRIKSSAGIIEARRFDVKSEIAASFWYDASGRWVKCAFEAQGSKIDYVLREIPD